MATRTTIQRRLSEPDAVERVVQLMGASPGMHRTGLAERLCGEYGFIDAGGGLRRSGCLKALRTLEERGHFVLPAPRTETGPARARRLEHSVPAPDGVPHSVEQIRGLELVVVESEEQMRTWNELFAREHPRGAGPLVGRQLRYLILGSSSVGAAFGDWVVLCMVVGAGTGMLFGGLIGSALGMMFAFAWNE